MGWSCNRLGTGLEFDDILYSQQMIVFAQNINILLYLTTVIYLK